MAVSKCQKCKFDVPLFAKKCPECGARLFHPVFSLIVAPVIAVSVSLAIVFGISSIIGDIPNATNQQAVEDPDLQSKLISDKEDISKLETMPESEPDEASSVDSELILGPGTYIVGQDIDAGKYDCVASSGFGVLRGELSDYGPAGFVQTMGSSSASIGGSSAAVEGADSYSNLTLLDRDTLYIEMSLKVKFIKK